MQLNGLLFTLPKEIKLLIGTFLIVLSVGFYSGLTFVGETSTFSSQGIQENYLGNENDEAAVEMKFKKNEKHMLSIIHSHILSMSVIFFLLSLILSITKLKAGIKKFLMIEPLLSVLLTFGGIYFLWKGILWMKYIVMISGILMTASFTISILIIYCQLFRTTSTK